MAGINFLSGNLVDDSTLSITSGTANAQFPLTNIQNDSPSLKFQSTTNSVTILVDTGVTSTSDTLALVGDPTGTLGVTVATFKNSVTTDFSSSVAHTVTLSSEFNMGLEYIADESGRYWQIELTGNGSFAELGNVYIGQRTNIAQNSVSVSSFFYGNKDQSSFRRNQYGQKFIDLRNKVKQIRGSIDHCTQTETQTLDDLWQIHGKNKPLWIVLDRDSDAMLDGNFRLSMYGYLNSIPGWKASGGQLYSTNLNMEQAI